MIASSTVHGQVSVERWPSELPLFAGVALISAGAWLLLTITIIGLAYAMLLGAFFFVAHAAFVAHIKGSAVRIGPDQFPELHAAVQRLSHRIRLEQAPDAYVMESGGALNAFAMRFMRSKIMVLYSDLLQACGDDHGARDMIIAHELGHIRAGHLRWQMALLPGMMVPFLGTAYSRAREYTCDRYGFAGAGDKEGALLGLTILAAGGKLARQVNRRALARQRNDLNTGWMTIGKWLSTHPPLAERIAALDPTLRVDWDNSDAGLVRAFGIVIGIPVLVTVLIVGAVIAGTQLLSPLGGLLADNVATPVAAASQEDQLAALLRTSGAAAAAADPQAALAMVTKAREEIERLASVAIQERGANRPVPADWDALVSKCVALRVCTTMPTDPFDGAPYGYLASDRQFVLFSSGPDGEPETDDDIVYDSTVGRVARGWSPR